MRKFTLILSAAAIMATAGTAAHAQDRGKAPMGDITRAQAQEMAEQRFDRMDTNKDGVLNAADREARKAERFDRMDANKDGMISRDEFNAAHTSRTTDDRAEKGDRMRHRTSWRGRGMHKGMAGQGGDVTKADFVAASLARFDQADANKDGILTADERKAAMQAKRAEWQAQHKENQSE